MINFKALTNNRLEYLEQVNLKGIMVSRHPYRALYILSGKQSIDEIKHILSELNKQSDKSISLTEKGIYAIERIIDTSKTEEFEFDIKRLIGCRLYTYSKSPLDKKIYEVAIVDRRPKTAGYTIYNNTNSKVFGIDSHNNRFIACNQLQELERVCLENNIKAINFKYTGGLLTTEKTLVERNIIDSRGNLLINDNKDTSSKCVKSIRIIAKLKYKTNDVGYYIEISGLNNSIIHIKNQRCLQIGCEGIVKDFGRLELTDGRYVITKDEMIELANIAKLRGFKKERYSLSVAYGNKYISTDKSVIEIDMLESSSEFRRYVVNNINTQLGKEILKSINTKLFIFAGESSSKQIPLKYYKR